MSNLQLFRLSIPRLPLPAVTALCLLTIAQISNAETIEPFTSDGCSLFPDGTFANEELWLACCTAHDYAYWQGGTYDEREQADLALEQCVADIGEPEIAKVMLAGVRVGGSPYFPTWYRWGYGWSYLRGYKALTAQEKQQIKALEQNRSQH